MLGKVGASPTHFEPLPPDDPPASDSRYQPRTLQPWAGSLASNSLTVWIKPSTTSGPACGMINRSRTPYRRHPVYEDLEASPPVSGIGGGISKISTSSQWMTAQFDNPSPFQRQTNWGYRARSSNFGAMWNQRHLNWPGACRVLDEADRVVVMDSDREICHQRFQTCWPNWPRIKLTSWLLASKPMWNAQIQAFYVVYKHFFQLLTGRAISFTAILWP